MKQVVNKTGRAVFASKFAAVATTVGSAVGLGNIWRFPYEAGQHGGGAFLICYLAFVFAIGLPVLLAEFIMGRGTRSNIFGAYRLLCPHGKWQAVGYLGIAASFLILGFYSVVAGWTVEYFLTSITGSLDYSARETGHAQFLEMTTGIRPLIWTMVFLFINTFILIRGVTKGIEKVSDILMPVLFLILIVFCINSATLPGFGKGMGYLFRPDFSKLTPPVVLGALGQAFFSLSLGLGCMMTYASYFSKNTGIWKTAVTTVTLDAAVAVLAGIIIFPAVFSFGLSPEAGPTLVFEVLPYIFNRIPGGYIWQPLFFLLLFMASLTSTVSMSEISISYFAEEKKMSRKKATWISALISIIAGLLCALSFGMLSDFKIFGMNFFNLFDYLSSNICLPIGGMVCSVFLGWVVKKNVITKEMSQGTGHRFRFTGLLVFLLRFICPTAILVIFLNSMGLI